MSKKKPTIETSVFGAEFVVLKHAMEAIHGIRYKLRMMGVTLSMCCYLYGYNMSVIHNTQQPESNLRKKSNSLYYHDVVSLWQWERPRPHTFLHMIMALNS